MPPVTVRGGGLQLKDELRRWRKVSGVSFLLSSAQREFLARDVVSDHGALSKNHYTLTGVDVKRDSARASDGLTGFFWTEAPVRGRCPLEHKYLFGRSVAAFSARVAEHKDKLLDTLRTRSDGAAGQLLLVTQVSASSRPTALAKKLFYTTGKEWKELNLSGCVTLSFNDVCDQCAAHWTANNREVPTVTDFLLHSGEGTKHVLERINVWTARGSGLGLKNKDFVKVKVPTGTGSRLRWAASRAALPTVWPQLRKRFRKRRR